MDAKETVMSDEKKAELWKQAQRDGSNPYCEFTPDELMTELVAYDQVEISFRAGIREVVEWIEANALGTHSTAFSILIVKWQAKLKEWGTG